MFEIILVAVWVIKSYFLSEKRVNNKTGFIDPLISSWKAVFNIYEGAS